MDKYNAICIVGMGACTPIGLDAPSSAASVRAGITRIAEHPYMIDKIGELMVVSMASFISDDITGSERFQQLAASAEQEALAVISKLKKSDIPCIVGLPSKRPGLPDDVAQKYPKAISCGHSAGLMAVQEGCQIISKGIAEFCLVGGVDSYMEPETLEWLDYGEQLHSDENIYGFIPGEAAGFALLASQNVAQKYGLKILGRIQSIATEHESNLIKTDTVCIGEGLTKAFRNVFKSLDYPAQKIDQTICDMNGERYRADEYGFTLVRTSEYFVNASDFQTPSDCWGDIGAASGLLFINLAISAWQRGYAKGSNVLIWTSSEGGERSALLLLKP
jgi:3-oxoacyl-[acyl-carrier-protein] synthase-1